MAKAKQPETEPEYEYIICKDSSCKLLQERVNYYIGAGYVPVGGIAINQGREPYVGVTLEFYQAMVKKTE
jgi:hypothetical protein